MKGQTDICWKVAFTTFDILRGQGSNFTNPFLFQRIGTVKDKTLKYISGHFQPNNQFICPFFPLPLNIEGFK